MASMEDDERSSSEEENDNDNDDNDEEMEDAGGADDGDGEGDGDGDTTMGPDGGGDDDDDDNEGDNEDDEDDDDDNEDQGDDSPLKSRPRPAPSREEPGDETEDARVRQRSEAPVLTSASGGPISQPARLPQEADKPFRPSVREEAVKAIVYDIVPTIAAPHSTSINAITATPDMRWVFSGGADGWIRKFHWPDTVNSKAMLTVAQRHPFVDSVTKAGVLTSYWENEEPSGKLLWHTIKTPKPDKQQTKQMCHNQMTKVHHFHLYTLSRLTTKPCGCYLALKSAPSTCTLSGMARASASPASSATHRQCQFYRCRMMRSRSCPAAGTRPS